MARYSIRPLRSEDFPLLMALEEEMFGDDPDGTLGPYYVRLCCEFFGDSCFLLEAGGELAGYLLSFTKGRESYCTTLALRPRFQGSRAVVKLIQAYIAAIADRVDVAWFTVEPGNEAARALHRMLGAEEVGVREDFYGPGTTRIVSKIDRAAFERLRHRFAKLGLVAGDAEGEASGTVAPLRRPEAASA
jgi:ribosomal protein S18 acetylase RimI-like enzyme